MDSTIWFATRICGTTEALPKLFAVADSGVPQKTVPKYRSALQKMIQTHHEADTMPTDTEALPKP